MFWVLLAINIVSIGFVLTVIQRVTKYVRRFWLEETRETLPFGFLRLKFVLYFYIGSMLAFAVASFTLLLHN